LISGKWHLPCLSTNFFLSCATVVSALNIISSLGIFKASLSEAKYADTTVAQLRKKLVDKHGKCHFPDNILCAVNQEIANDEVIVSDSDEVFLMAMSNKLVRLLE
jgi:molybdopterin converting factor small subunit